MISTEECCAHLGWPCAYHSGYRDGYDQQPGKEGVMTDIAADIEARHRRLHGLVPDAEWMNGEPDVCSWCGQVWPCDARRLLDENEQLRDENRAWEETCEELKHTLAAVGYRFDPDELRWTALAAHDKEATDE